MAQDFLGTVREIRDGHGLFRGLHDVDHQTQDFSADGLEIVHERLNGGAWCARRCCWAALGRLLVSFEAIGKLRLGWA